MFVSEPVRQSTGIDNSLTHFLQILVSDSVRHRALRLVRLAYSSISAEDFAVFVGMPIDKAVQGKLFFFLSVNVFYFCHSLISANLDTIVSNQTNF